MLKTAKEAKVDILNFTAHAHCFKLKGNSLTDKIQDIRAFFKIISPSLKAFPYSDIASIDLNLNLVPSWVSLFL